MAGRLGGPILCGRAARRQGPAWRAAARRVPSRRAEPRHRPGSYLPWLFKLAMCASSSLIALVIFCFRSAASALVFGRPPALRCSSWASTLARWSLSCVRRASSCAVWSAVGGPWVATEGNGQLNAIACPWVTEGEGQAISSFIDGNGHWVLIDGKGQSGCWMAPEGVAHGGWTEGSGQ